MPLTEDCKIGGTTNPYGTSKLMIEYILQDLYKSDNTWDIVILRYFNPVGAHESGLIGEVPKGTPNNLMPYISRVAAGKLKRIISFLEMIMIQKMVQELEIIYMLLILHMLT